MSVVITICVAVLLCLLTILFCRRYAEKTYSAVDAVLDGVLMMNEQLPQEEDSRLAKLTHKAVKLTQLHTAHASQNKREKEAIQEFLSDMSHQMKTPLSGISMYTDLLLEGKLSSNEQQEFLSRIRSGTDKLQWMMDSLVKMSRLEVGAIELSPVPSGIKQTLSESISMVMASAVKKNISIQTEPFQDVELLHDKKWTAEAITNILENAVKYSKENGEIHIKLEKLVLYTKIRFTDYGIGLESSDFNAIFKRFYRGKNTENINGAGLGLYLTSVILEKQGGYILVDSKPGEYTAFSIFLQNCKK